MITHKLLFSTFLVLLCFIATAQQKELYIDYKLVTKQDLWKIRSELRVNDQYSLYKTTRKLYLGVHGSREIDTVYSYTHVYKDFANNIMQFEDMLPNAAHVFVHEEMNLFDWKLENEKTEILGYNCQKASCNFRGRDYIAWFTTDLPFKAAPWKIHALPFVVLQVQTTDNFLFIKAKNLRIQQAQKIENPDKKEKYISWKEFEELYEVKMEQCIARAMAMVAKIEGETLRGGLPREEILNEWNNPDFKNMDSHYKKRREEE